MVYRTLTEFLRRTPQDAAAAAAHAKQKLMERQEKLAVNDSFRSRKFLLSPCLRALSAMVAHRRRHPRCGQRITEQSAELESEAENFATLAQQIRKNMENKWWK